MLALITKRRLFAVFRAIYFLPCAYTFFYLSRGLIENYVGSKVIATSSESVIGEGGFQEAPTTSPLVVNFDFFGVHVLHTATWLAAWAVDMHLRGFKEGF